MKDAGQEGSRAIPVEEGHGQTDQVSDPTRAQVGHEFNGAHGEDAKEQVGTHRLDHGGGYHPHQNQAHLLGL